MALLALLHADTSGLEPFPTGVPKLLEGREGVPSSLGPVSSLGDSAKSPCIASFSRISDEQVNKEAVSGSP